MKREMNRRLLPLLCLMALGCTLLPPTVFGEEPPGEDAGFVTPDFQEAQPITGPPLPPPEAPQQVAVETPPPTDPPQQAADHTPPPPAQTQPPEPPTEIITEPATGAEVSADWVEGFDLASGRPGGVVDLFVPVRFLLTGEAYDTNTDSDGLYLPPGADEGRYTQALETAMDWAEVTLEAPSGAAGMPFGLPADFSATSPLMENGRNYGYAAFYGLPIWEEAEPGMYPVSFLLRYQARGEDAPREVWLRTFLGVSAYDVVGGAVDTLDIAEQAEQILLTPEPPETTEPTPEATPTEAPAAHYQETLTVALEEALYQSVQPGDVVVLPLAISLESREGAWQSNLNAQGEAVPFGAPPEAFRQDIPGDIEALSVELDAGQLAQAGFPFGDSGWANRVATVISGGVNRGYAVFEGLVARAGALPKDNPLHFTIRWTVAEASVPSAPGEEDVP